MSFLTDRFLVFFLAVWGLSIVFRPYRGFYKFFVIAANFVFYTFFGISAVLILITSILVNYILLRISEKEKVRKLVLGLSVGLNLFFLAFFKYFNNLVEWLAGDRLGAGMEIIAPIGISFFTFKIISVLVDSYRRKIEVRSLADYLAYVSFFPQISAGPIGRYKEFDEDINRLSGFGVDSNSIGTGKFWTLLVSGCLKMYLIGGVLFEVVNQTINSPQNFGRTDLLLGMLGVSFYIYANFSGYSDISEVVSGVLGFRTPKNFNDPYRSGGFGEFWQRWHISLSTWLRDYLYIPLGGNRKGVIRKYLNLLVTMLIGGVWHGVGVNFLVWGGAQGVMLVINHILDDLGWSKFGGGIIKGFCWFVTFGLINVTWIIFYPKNLGMSARYFENLISPGGSLVTLWSLKLGGVLMLAGILSIFGKEVWGLTEKALTGLPFLPRYLLLVAIFYLIIVLGPSNYVAPAAYFNF